MLPRKPPRQLGGGIQAMEGFSGTPPTPPYSYDPSATGGGVPPPLATPCGSSAAAGNPSASLIHELSVPPWPLPSHGDITPPPPAARARNAVPTRPATAAATAALKRGKTGKDDAAARHVQPSAAQAAAKFQPPPPPPPSL